ncbi:MAG: hypothetical protein ICV64_12120 [Thermoleophilia bacterium]|nr:hypothetical protein [Thermoleophilia bacterium]
MRRDYSVWLLAGPLVASAALVAHALAYRLAGSSPQVASDHSEHHYLSHLPVLLTPAVLLVALALSLRLARARAGAETAPLPGVPVAVGALTVFALQEWLERLAHAGRLDATAAAEPTLALGLGLAGALSLVAVLAGRLLLRSAERVAGLPARARAAVVLPRAIGSPPAPAGERGPSRPAPARPTGRAPPSLVAA